MPLTRATRMKPRSAPNNNRPKPPQTRPQTHDLYISFLLLAATLAIYAQVRHFDFVNYDDPEYVNNPHIRSGLTPQSSMGIHFH